MEKIIISPLVEEKLYDLVDILFENGYFGFLQSAIVYKEKIVHFISSIPNLKKRKLKMPNMELGIVAINPTAIQRTL